MSVPSRFYNLLAIGRPVILVSEADAEAALTVSEHDLGWVVEPGDPDELAQNDTAGGLARGFREGERAAVIAQRFNFAAAMAGYSGLIARLLRQRRDVTKRGAAKTGTSRSARRSCPAIRSTILIAADAS